MAYQILVRDDGDPRPVEVASLIVKLASRCNLSCDYCYYYHGADQSWSAMPRVVSEETCRGLIEAVRHLHAVQSRPPLVVFHGGEPLLFGVSRFVSLVDALVDAVPDVQLTVQTNGTIYNDRLEAGLLRHRNNLTFSVSADGFRAENDRHRLGAQRESKYDRIEATIVRARDAGVLDSVLLVLDPATEPRRAFEFMVWSGAASYDLLLRDGDHDALPPGKQTVESTEAGTWLVKLFGIYATANPRFGIRILDEAAQSILTRIDGLDIGSAQQRRCVLTVDTNGEIKQVDTLRINDTKFDRLTGESIGARGIEATVRSPENTRVVEEQASLSAACQRCSYLDCCGGGYLQHRFGAGHFRNPSIYCADYLHLFSRLDRALRK